MSTKQTADMPRQLVILLVVSAIISVVIMGLGGVALMYGGGRAALYLLMAGGLIGAGTYGTLSAQIWAEQFLAGGYVIVTLISFFVLAFGLVVGKSDFAFWANVAAGSCVVVFGSMAAAFRTQTIKTYLWNRRIDDGLV